MLVDRIIKETTDISRDFLDMSWWLDEGETITKVVSQTVMLGAYGWSDAPYPLQGGDMPYDPFPLIIQSAVVTTDGAQLEVFVNEGSPGLAYTCQFVLDGSSKRRVTIEMGVQVTGVPFGSLGSGPLPSYLAVTISDTPPIPAQCGQLWFDSKDPQLYVYYCDPTSSQWVIATGYAGGLTSDAPSDGQIYGRQNAAWVNIAGSGGGGGGYLPLIGGNVSGIIKLVDPGGALQSNRNITIVSPPTLTTPSNFAFTLTTNYTGTNLDPTTSTAYIPTAISNYFNAVNTGALGVRGFQVASFMGPGSIGSTFSAVTSTVVQQVPGNHSPGNRKWAPDTVYAKDDGLTNPYNGSTYYAVVGGKSAPSGNGPDGYGQAIIDGTITWAYQGPGVPRYWAPITSYPNRGELVTNPNNGGLFRVETPGVSGTGAGPPRIRNPLAPVRLASVADVGLPSGTLTIDGVASAIGDRVLLKDQTDQTTNGIYVVSAGAWIRSTDVDSWGELVSRFTTVTEGAVNAGSLPGNVGQCWFCNVPRGGIIGAAPITWVKIPLPTAAAIADGTVVWSLRTIGNYATSYIGMIANQQSSFNAGGKSFNESIGNVWGAVIGSRLNPAATFYSASVPLEIDDVVQGSVRNINALKVVRNGKQAQLLDIGILLSAGVGGITPDGTPVRGYKNAMIFNRSVDADYGTGISFETVGSFNYHHMAGCIDLRMVRADGLQGPFGSGFLLRGSNGMWDQFGAWQLRYGSITPTASGLAIDVTNVELQSITIAPGNGGAGWSFGDGYKSTDGAFGNVTSVDGTGQMLTVNVAIRSQVPAASQPATVTLSPFNPEAVADAVGSDPVPGTVGPTGDVVWATPAIGTPTYAAPATRTLNIGTGSADVINIGHTGATVNLLGTVVGGGGGGNYLPLSGGIVSGPLTVTGQGQFNFIKGSQPIVLQGNTGLPGAAPNSSVSLIGADGATQFIAAYAFRTPNPLTEWACLGANGTLAAPTAVQNNDILGRFSACGYQGAAYASPGMMQIFATESFTPTSTGTGFSFQGILNGTTVQAEALGIRNGSVGVSVFSDYGYRLDVNSIAKSSRFLVTGSNTATNTALIVSGLPVTLPIPPLPAAAAVMLVGPNVAGTNTRQAMFAGNNINLLTFVRTGSFLTTPAATTTQPIGGIEAMGYDTTWTTTPNANVMLVSAGTWSGTSHPAYITFSTTAINSVTLTEAGRISPNGNLLLGLTTDGANKLDVVGAVRLNGSLGFNNTTPVAKQTVSGAKGSNAALASLIAALAAYGLITDTTTA